MNRTTRTSYVLLIVTVAILISIVPASTTRAAAQQVRILHSFSESGKDGNGPQAGMIFDKAGNLYGTTTGGGKFNYGTVFELTPKTGGGWTEKVLHNFNNDGKDGYDALEGLILDASGNLYGTAYSGGSNNLGIVFELIQQPGGGWAERVLYNFDGVKGSTPFGSLAFDTKGNLYGNAVYGGSGTNCSNVSGCGVVFQLTPKPAGAWAESVLHMFGIGTDGSFPIGALVLDKVGNLYGVANSNGTHNNGMVFELIPGAGGNWMEKDLHDFDYSAVDGYDSEAGLVFDKAGNLYGSTVFGGPYNGGTVFELTPIGGGTWTEALLHSFGANVADGRNPYFGALILDMAGNLYGTTYGGGANSLGTAFELTLAGGSWTENILANFSFGNAASPAGGLASDGHGNLYGTTVQGGSSGFGTVFEIAP